MLNRLGMLLTIGCLLTGFGSAGTLRGDPADAIKKELKAMAGTWKAVSIETDGKKAPDEILKKVVMTRDESGKTVIRRGDMVLLESIVKVDPSKKPKTVDTEQTVGAHKGKTIQGIYEFDGDTFRVCLAPPGKERPSEFSAKAGSGNSLAVYMREKK